MDAIQGESHIDVKDDRESHILSRQKGNINLIDVGLTKEMKSQHVSVQQKWADGTTNSVNRGAKGNKCIKQGIANEKIDQTHRYGSVGVEMVMVDIRGSRGDDNERT